MTQVFTDSALDNAWAFWVLELPISASMVEVEKAARDITAKLKLNVPHADTFATPAGQGKRDEFLVRDAKAYLQNPQSRLLAEFWYLPPDISATEDESHLKPCDVWRKIMGVPSWELSDS